MKRIPITENNSQFCITFRKMESLDHKNVVIGKIIKGNDNLFKIENYARKIGKPYAEIIISDCGEVSKERFEILKYDELGKCSEAGEVGATDLTGKKTQDKVGIPRVKNCKCHPIC